MLDALLFLVCSIKVLMADFTYTFISLQGFPCIRQCGSYSVYNSFASDQSDYVFEDEKKALRMGGLTMREPSILQTCIGEISLLGFFFVLKSSEYGYTVSITV
ncbi:hypothetical protein FB192DRAFT_1378715, partial [Mucor lusitanicus]